MGKTWKDLPKGVSGYKPFRRRKKPLSDKLKEPPKAEVLERLRTINKLPEDERDYWDAWST